MKEAKIKLTGPSIFNVNSPLNSVTEIQIVVGEKKLTCEFPKPVEYAAGWLCDIFNIMGLSKRYDEKEDLIIVRLEE